MPVVTIKSNRSDAARRNEFDNPFSKLPLIIGGIIFLMAALFDAGHKDTARAAAWLAIGAGMIIYGVTDILLRRSHWRFAALFVALALWFGGVSWALSLTATR